MKKVNYKRSEDVRVSHKNKILILFLANKDRNFTNIEIQKTLGFQNKEQVHKRTSDLMDDGLISEVGFIEIKNKFHTLYQLTPNELVEEMKQKRFEQRKNEWFEQGLRKGYVNL
jgi:uncharacterized protein YqiB (DUF1249 family)